jgi:hypothetical protein
MALTPEIATSFSCRFYHDDDGRIHEAPSVEQLQRIFEVRHVAKPTQDVGSMCSLSAGCTIAACGDKHFW